MDYNNITEMLDLINNFIYKKDNKIIDDFYFEITKPNKITFNDIIKNNEFDYKTILNDYLYKNEQFKLISTNKNRIVVKKYYNKYPLTMIIQPLKHNLNETIQITDIFYDLFMNQIINEFIFIYKIPFYLINICNFVVPYDNLNKQFKQLIDNSLIEYNNTDLCFCIYEHFHSYMSLKQLLRTELTDDDLHNLFFQVFFSYAFIIYKLGNFRHNDFNINSFIVQKNKINSLELQLEDMDYKMENVNFVLKLNNYTYSTLDGFNNNYICIIDNPSYDIYTFLKSIYEYTKLNIINFDKIKNIISNFIPIELIEMDIQNEEQFISHYFDTIIPSQILSKNNFFSNFINMSKYSVGGKKKYSISGGNNLNEIKTNSNDLNNLNVFKKIDNDFKPKKYSVSNNFLDDKTSTVIPELNKKIYSDTSSVSMNNNLNEIKTNSNDLNNLNVFKKIDNDFKPKKYSVSNNFLDDKTSTVIPELNKKIYSDTSSVSMNNIQKMFGGMNVRNKKLTDLSNTEDDKNDNDNSDNSDNNDVSDNSDVSSDASSDNDASNNSDDASNSNSSSNSSSGSESDDESEAIESSEVDESENDEDFEPIDGDNTDDDDIEEKGKLQKNLQRNKLQKKIKNIKKELLKRKHKGKKYDSDTSLQFDSDSSKSSSKSHNKLHYGNKINSIINDFKNEKENFDIPVRVDMQNAILSEAGTVRTSNTVENTYNIPEQQLLQFQQLEQLKKSQQYPQQFQQPMISQQIPQTLMQPMISQQIPQTLMQPQQQMIPQQLIPQQQMIPQQMMQQSMMPQQFEQPLYDGQYGGKKEDKDFFFQKKRYKIKKN